MRVTVTVNGEPRDVDVDADTDDMTLQQMTKLEKVLGMDRTATLMGARGPKAAATVAVLPSTTRAILYVKVNDLMPDAGLKIGDFDVPLAELVDELDDDEPVDDEPVVIPMTLPDGAVVQGASEHVDPTREAVTG